MPRFSVFSLDDEPRELPAVEDEPDEMIRVRRSNATFVGPLSCLSPDGRSVYSLSTVDREGVFIESHHLPLEGTTDQLFERDLPVVIRTHLPESIASTLRVDAPVELLCVEGDDTVTRPPRDTEQTEPQKCLLPLLCLYTRKSVFLLRLSFTCPFDDSVGLVMGEVVFVQEPLESQLDGRTSSTYIVRVRPAPQRRMGYAVTSPPGAMAVLLHDGSVNEYTLFLYHGVQRNLVTEPLVCNFERLEGDDDYDAATIVDFAFGQSNGLALLASMSIHLLRASGQVLGASPVLFDGAVVSRAVVKDSRDYLQFFVDTHEQTTARWRQTRAALRFFDDAFPTLKMDQNNYLTARVLPAGNPRTSTTWPVQIQGPVVLTGPLEPEDTLVERALTLEPFHAHDLVGVAIARDGWSVDFAAVPVTALLPRFSYEIGRDRMEIDDALAQLGVVVECIAVTVKNESSEGMKGKTMRYAALVRDPVVENMIHYASSQGVLSISTNAMSFLSNKVQEDAFGDYQPGFLSPSSKRANQSIRTSAWSCVDASAGRDQVSLTAAVISGDAHLGHTLIVRLSNGTMEAINLTESRYIHESRTLFESNRDQRQDNAVDKAREAVEQTPPMYELLKPLYEKLQGGLSSMSKIVGSSTAPKDIKAASMATALAIRKRCDEEVVLPLKEMNQLAASRLGTAREMCKSQVSQLEALKASLESLKKRAEATNATVEAAARNANALSQRSSTLLQACQDLQPTLTRSEVAYFQQLKRLKAKLTAWEEKVSALRSASEEFSRSSQPRQSASDLNLTSSDIDKCHSLLKGQELLLSQSAETLKATEREIQEVAASTGLGIDGHGSSLGGQMHKPVQ